MRLLNIDTQRFAGPTREIHYNGSILRRACGDYLFAFRQDIYNNDFKIPSVIGWNRKYGNEAKIGICQLKKDFSLRAHSHRIIPFPDTLKAGNRFEDPRLFHHQGKLWCAFVNVSKHFNAASQGICRLNKYHEPVNIWYPKYGKNHNAALVERTVIYHPQGYVTTHEGRRAFEKNWMFFSHDRELYCIYSINPYIILRLNPKKRRLKAVANRPLQLQWKWGELRGGTPPIRVGDSYLTFFHSSRRIEKVKEKVYAMGAFLFHAKPPFDITHFSRQPLLEGNPWLKKTKGKIPCVFPAGSFPRPGGWGVSLGYHDSYNKICLLSDRELQENLTPV